MKKLIFNTTILSVLFSANVAIAGTHGDTCTSSFPDITCSTWDESDTSVNDKLCICNECPSSKPDMNTASGTTSSGYYLYNQCTCQSCRCANNPNTAKTDGSCSCTNGVADYSTCTAPTTTYYLCSDSASGGCRTAQVTIDGVLYCMTSGASNGCSSAPGVAASYTMSRYCSNYYGIASKIDGCFVMACNSGFTPSDDKKSCVCAKGYYGTPSSGCTQCPTSGGVVGTTIGTNTTDITGCYIPAGEISWTDSTGTYECATASFYTK